MTPRMFHIGRLRKQSFAVVVAVEHEVVGGGFVLAEPLLHQS
jgi:hypothetical protein